MEKFYIRALVHLGGTLYILKKQELLLIFGTWSRSPPPDPLSALLFHTAAPPNKNKTVTQALRSLMVERISRVFRLRGQYFHTVISLVLKKSNRQRLRFTDEKTDCRGWSDLRRDRQCVSDRRWIRKTE